ncbi:hypothetical protein GCM10010331_56080 [Streptomyces xanthochromogenes]|uniref:hypothetical protein n=1 Tax=Streptomyces xanthochromogenes TaxID=67384 RepID=UPI001678E40D|nr:hypothetical protein [Streptomyces xanthochromogenes]GHB61113.1 hypothetical protein GCM10010331_56080 [Streptomyces xanthochromogenes]
MHRFSRITGLASVGLAAALLASGCSSGGSDKASDKPSGQASGRATAAGSSPTQAPAGSGAASTPAQGKASGAPAGSAPGAKGLDGNWVAVTRGKPVALVIKGKVASVLGEHLCNGTASSTAGTTALRLKCADGNTTRVKGTARMNGAKLEVSWDGFGKDEFSRNRTNG